MSLLDIISKKDIEEEKGFLDLTDETTEIEIQESAEELYKNAAHSEEITELEKICIKNKKQYSLKTHSAVKIAKSKKMLSEIDVDLNITIIFAVYKEHIRILRKEEHELGEDFLMRKIMQLEKLFNEFSNINWDMLIVDDGCPLNSGKIAEKILKKSYQGENVEVIYIQDAIDQKLDVIRPMTSVDMSRKGGAVHYGMWYALQKKRKNHIIIYTDADLSSHLGQCGLLINSIVKENKYAAIASRREYESVVVKEKSRDLRGKLFIYIWKRMLRRLNYVIDSQCGFKAFRADIAEKIIVDTIEKQFAFDIELLLRTDLLKRHSIAKIPITWIDSAEASTTSDSGSYLQMLKSTAQMYHLYLPANAVSHKFAFFVRDIDEQDWDILIKNVPEGIQLKSALHYDIYSEITVEDFMEILKKNKKYKQN